MMKTPLRIALLVVLSLTLAFASAAQTPEPEPTPVDKGQQPDSLNLTPDRRKISPTVGTGGSIGGPSGLFTIYDGQTLRARDFNFTISYSNFDRDPGNVDLTEVPVSFQYGITNRLEFFFTTNAYRGIKVNNPQNLSGFYLPNSRLFCGPPSGLCSGPAIVLSPSGPTVGTLANMAIFRPLNNQPFVAFPFVGGSAGTFGLSPGQIGALFGFPGFNAVLGPPISNSNSNFGAAANFPGIGSPVGGILPGLVLATQTLPATPLSSPIIVPTTFTIAPSYLPDAPFINSLYGRTNLQTFTVGVKYRLSAPGKAFGRAIIPFYRFYRDKAIGAGGFDQLQRGASPGGSIGDFGIVLVTEARLRNWANISVNSGFILNSSVKGDFPGGKFTLLDRPNELLSGIGFDFPLNKYLQPIFELRSTRYVGGHTPNAFGNNPVDVLGGLKFYSKVFNSGIEFGFGAAYRRHLNQQDRSSFDSNDFNIQINQVTGINIPGRGFVSVPVTSAAATSRGFPLGFTPSSDPNGFIFQFWIGYRHKECYVIPPPPPEDGALLEAEGGDNSPILPCPPGTRLVQAAGGERCSTDRVITVHLKASLFNRRTDEPKTDRVPEWLIDIGEIQNRTIEGEFYRADWVLTNAEADKTYMAKIHFKDARIGEFVKQSNGDLVEASYTVTPKSCPNCLPCPTLTAVKLECPAAVQKESPSESKQIIISASADINNNAPDVTTNYQWNVSAGSITGDQSGSRITLDLTGVNETVNISVTASVSALGCPPDTKTDSCAIKISIPPPTCAVFDSYRNIRFNDEKARLDNFAIQLKGEPGTVGYYVSYAGAGCDDQVFDVRKRDARAKRSSQYLINTRGLGHERVQLSSIEGGHLDPYGVILWTCPVNVQPVMKRTSPIVQQSLDSADCPTKQLSAPAAQKQVGKKVKKKSGAMKKKK